jgi:hypothetical protein
MSTISSELTGTLVQVSVIIKFSGSIKVTRTYTVEKNCKFKTFRDNEANATIETKISTAGGQQER